MTADPKLSISQPCYGGGIPLVQPPCECWFGRARAAQKLNSFTCTGEGGYPDVFIPYRDNIITQVATGLFGVEKRPFYTLRSLNLNMLRS